MTARPCAICGEATTASYGLCPACLSKRAEDERVAQGLPTLIDDPVAVERVATHVRTVQRGAA